MRSTLLIATLVGALSGVASTAAEARNCSELRSLCWTMRDDKSDCTRPYQRCLQTGVFITPLGRVFKATK
jgi:hypothetical protein